MPDAYHQRKELHHLLVAQTTESFSGRLSHQANHAQREVIEAGLCGHRMPSTREELDEVVTNGSDVIAVQIDKRNVANRHDLSVARLEIFPIDDGVIHLGFDLTHERNLRGSVKCLGGLSP